MVGRCRRPRVLTTSTLFCWQTKHSSTNLRTLDLRPSQNNSFLTIYKVFLNHECPPTREVCNSKSTFCLSWDSLHIYKRYLYHSESFFHTNISNTLGYFWSCWIIFHTDGSCFHYSLASTIQSGCIIEITQSNALTSMYFLERASATIFYPLFINNLRVISQHISYTFLFLFWGQSLFQEVFKTIMIFFYLEVPTYKVRASLLACM